MSEDKETKNFVTTRAMGSVFYDITKDSVIVRIVIPCICYPSTAVEEAANKATMPFILSIAKDLADQFPDRKP